MIQNPTIGIDARLAGQTGVGTYTRNLLRYLPENTSVSIVVFCLSDDQDMLKQCAPYARIIPVSYRWHTMNEQIGFCHSLMKHNLDLMHFTYFSYPVAYQRRYIATVHDLTPLMFATGKASTKHPLIYQLKSLAFRFVLKNQISHASAIITPTKTVKQEIEHWYFQQSEQQKIHPIYEGVDSAIQSAQPDGSAFSNVSPGFFLYVGNFYPHKNVSKLFEGYARANPDRMLICAGPEDYFAERVRKQVAALGLRDRVRFIHHPSHGELSWLYQNAHALMHPSLSEGFGLPIVEAMQFHLPVIASDIPVFREILCNRFLAFDPQQINSIAQMVKKADQSDKAALPVGDPTEFSFPRMAKETMNLYQSVLNC